MPQAGKTENLIIRGNERGRVHAWREIHQANIVLQPGVPDSICWILTNSGQYSARSAYLLHFIGRTNSDLLQEVWRSWAPPKHRFFAWLLLQDRLWCADRLQRRGWPNEYFCPLCRRNLETAHHLFVECPFTTCLWLEAALWPNCQGVAAALQYITVSVPDFREYLMLATDVVHRKGMSSLFILICSSVWRERNERIFRDKETSQCQIINFIKDEAQAWAFAGAKALRKLLWEPP